MQKLTKKELSHLRKVANSMPKVYDNSEHKTLVTVYGETLLKQGIDKVNGVPVDRDKRYVQTIKGMPINHFNKLKAFCEQGKHTEAQSYINSFYTKPQA